MAEHWDIRLALIEMKSKFALLKYEREMEALSMWIWDANRPKPVRLTMKWISEIRILGNNRWVKDMTHGVKIFIKCQFSNKKFGSNSVCRQCCYVDNCFNAYGLEGNPGATDAFSTLTVFENKKLILYLARGGTILWDQFDRALWETMMQNNPILGWSYTFVNKTQRLW